MGLEKQSGIGKRAQAAFEGIDIERELEIFKIEILRRD